MKHTILPRLLLPLVLLLAACGSTTDQGAQGGASPSASSVQAVATAAASPTQATTVAQAATTAAPTTVVTAGPDEYINPVIDRDFPDPDVLKVGDTYYAYATNAGGDNIQAVKSADLVSWERLDDPLPIMPTWARAGLTWAPEVTTTADGSRYVMYFTARDTASDKQCIGVATSDKPEGPFTDSNDKPFICQADVGGSIDASSFAEGDGTRYVLWKNDGNCCGFDTYLYLQKVSGDGLTLEGEPTQLIKQDQAWEGNLVEAPTLWKNENKYFLFYSANSYAGVDYATGYAVADSITGPYTKPLQKAFMSTDFKNAAALGPGGQDIVVDPDGDTFIMFHSWDASASYRRVMLEEIVWENGTPVVKGPDKGPQPKP